MILIRIYSELYVFLHQEEFSRDIDYLTAQYRTHIVVYHQESLFFSVGLIIRNGR